MHALVMFGACLALLGGIGTMVVLGRVEGEDFWTAMAAVAGFILVFGAIALGVWSVSDEMNPAPIKPPITAKP